MYEKHVQQLDTSIALEWIFGASDTMKAMTEIVSYECHLSLFVILAFSFEKIFLKVSVPLENLVYNVIIMMLKQLVRPILTIMGLRRKCMHSYHLI